MNDTELIESCDVGKNIVQEISLPIYRYADSNVKLFAQM